MGIKKWWKGLTKESKWIVQGFLTALALAVIITMVTCGVKP